MPLAVLCIWPSCSVVWVKKSFQKFRLSPFLFPDYPRAATPPPTPPQAEEDDSLNDNSNKCLERFELLEALIRLALIKMPKPKNRGAKSGRASPQPVGGRPQSPVGMTGDLSQVLEELFAKHICPYAEQQAPKDEWRRSRMYRRDVNDVLLRFQSPLNLLYKQLCANAKIKKLDVDTFFNFCEDQNLLRYTTHALPMFLSFAFPPHTTTAINTTSSLTSSRFHPTNLLPLSLPHSLIGVSTPQRFFHEA
jgi:hypothetical protein